MLLFTSLYNYFNAHMNMGSTSILPNFDHMRLQFSLTCALQKLMNATYVDSSCCFLVSTISDKVERW